MAATLSTQPAARAFTLDPIWTEVETDLITGTAAYFEITISGAGPSIAETLTLTWPGGSITYTVAAAWDTTGLLWPEKGGATLEDYTNTIGEFLRQRADVTEVFDITVENAAGGIIRITRKYIEAFNINVTDGFSNVAVTANDGTASSAEENLHAYVEVWSDTGDFNTDRRLIALHSPYDVSRAATDIDIAAAFAHLAPHLPDPDTINPASPPGSLPMDTVTDSVQKYQVRVADKYGTPAEAEALFSNGPYIALLGSRSLEAWSSGVITLLHNYRRRDGNDFHKPVGKYQPDWIYYLNATADDVYVALTVYWSDGTNSAYNPWGTTTHELADGYTPYWFVAGFRQLMLHDLTPSGGTDPDAYIVGYDWKLQGTSAVLATVRFDIIEFDDWEHYILFDNGAGGMETVWMRGKTTEAYLTTGEEFRRSRRPDDSAQEGDLGIYATQGRPAWEMQTGWYPDPFYLEHLRQLPLGEAWLVDRIERRLLKVIVQPGTLEDVQKDDETLYSMKINVRAAWLDAAANI